MRDLLKRYLDLELSRREFGKSLAALGFSAAAVSSIASSLAAARDPLPAEGRRFTGTGAEVFTETLRAAGIRWVFGTTGTGMSPFFDALATRPDPQLILSISESQATSMAHGYELVSGETAALFVPGVAIPSTMNNLYNAWKDRSAIAVFSDGPSNKYPGRNMFQQMDDWLDPMVSFTKWRWQVDNDYQVGEMVRRALKLAGTPPGGPVHIRFPLNILGAEDVRTMIYPQSRFHVPVEMRPKPELVENAARLLVEAEHPLLCAGSEITRAGANDELVALAELLGADVAQGFSVYGDMPFRHDLFAGFYGLGVPRNLAKADVFLNLGAPMPDPGIFAPPVPRRTKVVHARVEYEDIASVYPTDIAIAAGMKETIEDLTDAVKDLGGSKLRRAARDRREAAAAATRAAREKAREQAKAHWDASPMSWERVSAELENELDRDAIVVAELDYRTPFYWLDFSRGGKTLIGQTTGFALGWGVGAAMGAKIASPDRQSVCLVGDGALLFGQVEALWSAARYEIPVIIVVMNNVSYDNERNRIQDRSPLMRKQDTRELWKDITCYLGNPDVDFTKVAGAFGVPAARADTPAELVAALRRARDVTREGRPFLLDARIMQVDRRGNPTVQTWHPELSIAGLRNKKV